MVSALDAQATAGSTFLGKLLAACDYVDDPDYWDITSTVIAVDGRKVTAKLVTPSGDAYRVTVEWISEDSP